MDENIAQLVDAFVENLDSVHPEIEVEATIRNGVVIAFGGKQYTITIDESTSEEGEMEVKFWVVRFISAGVDFCCLEDFATKKEADDRVAKMEKEGTEVVWSEPRFDDGQRWPENPIKKGG